MDTFFLIVKQVLELDTKPKVVDLPPLPPLPQLPEINQQLFEAVSSGNVEKCKELLKELGTGQEKELNVKDENFETLLAIACEEKGEEFTKICELLLLHGADINAPSGRIDPEKPIFIAARQSNINTCKLLLEHGADVDTTESIYNRTMLYYAARYGTKEMCEFLLDHGANINAVDKFGNTPLHGAYSMDQHDIIELLIRRGANVDARNSYGRTPMKFPTTVFHDAKLDSITTWVKEFIADLVIMAMVAFIGFLIVCLIKSLTVSR